MSSMAQALLQLRSVRDELRARNLLHAAHAVEVELLYWAELLLWAKP